MKVFRTIRRLILTGFTTVAIICGGGKLQMENVEWRMENGGRGTTPTTDILHSSLSILHSSSPRPQPSTPSIPFWRLDSITTNTAVSYERPAGSGRNEYWWKRGGIETAFRFHLDGFTFPLGTNDITSLMATAFGAVRAFARRPETEILASANRLAAEPFQSEFWYGRGTNANYFLTWRNFRFAEPPHYENTLSWCDTVRRFIMCGISDFDGRCDIPHGSVRGFVVVDPILQTTTEGRADIGLQAIDRQQLEAIKE